MEGRGEGREAIWQGGMQMISLTCQCRRRFLRFRELWAARLEPARNGRACHSPESGPRSHSHWKAATSRIKKAASSLHRHNTHVTSSSGPSLYVAPISLAILMPFGYGENCLGSYHFKRETLLSRILLRFPSKSIAHWLSVQQAKVTFLPIS